MTPDPADTTAENPYSGDDWVSTVAVEDGLVTARNTAGEVTLYRDADGNVIINKAAWGGHYFRNVETHLRDFKANTTAAENAFIEFWGTGTYRWVDNSGISQADNNTIYATFRSDWLTSWWNNNTQNRYDAAQSNRGSITSLNSNFAVTTIYDSQIKNYDYPAVIGSSNYSGYSTYNPYSTYRGYW